MPHLKLQLVPGGFTVCRLRPTEPIPPWANSEIFSSATRTADELSLVCPTAQVPAHIPAERGWRLLKVVGPLEFNAVGILSCLCQPLAQAGISILATGTFDTDYLLIKADRLDEALRLLIEAGHSLQQT